MRTYSISCRFVMGLLDTVSRISLGFTMGAKRVEHKTGGKDTFRRERKEQVLDERR